MSDYTTYSTDFVDFNKTFERVANGSDNNNTATEACLQSAYVYDHTYVRSRLVVDVGFVLVLCGLGLVGNAVSFCVLGRMTGGTTPCLLRALAVADSLYLFTCIFFQAILSLYTYVGKFRETFSLYPYVDRFTWPLASIAQTASVWIVVLVTANRWVAICHPLKAKQTDTKRRAGIAIFVVAISALLFNIPTFFEMEVMRKPLPCNNNVTRLVTLATAMSRDPKYQLGYKMILCFLVRSFVPLVLLIFLNVQLMRAIRFSASQDGKIPHEHGNAHNRLTVLVIAVVFIYIACEIPDFTYRVLLTVKLYGSSSRLTWAQLSYLGLVANIMLTVNSAVNFLIYCLVGKSFRQCLKKQCCGQPGGKLRWYRPVDASSTKSTMVTSLKGGKPV